MTIQFKALPTQDVRALQRGGPDAYGNTPERKVSDGDGMPCRHCLKNIADGDDYLILAYRPFPKLQPYAETGPIFLHAQECERAAESQALPEILESPDYIVRGYGRDDRIVYGSGGVIATDAIAARAEALLERDEIAYVHVRSARNNCFQCRIERV
ncbi:MULTISPECIES: DUF1203 domain-containing protein [unclassified Mesorhizobium]|uniref:DUF1203 domain-containing protein n=1 Tax=unclassified Mesorhizobium TaxID=325217 RepID=UPI001129014B|nr:MULTISPECIES: DUF1203 domain-containing protein [unclassified Mesorhizobium]TPJ46264.1 DUF1203 domain-containing protein [Mesorhizobium sp. B2-6-6]MBZ9998437.1 DUF1203 domain-containing protein [Mesorhizobium sp. B264B2A]MCA0004982.1 DUF1203 domain-containing protein [Mesorhizobium sp. B264B1B]MCA0019494.1 DUF1203 domain-containing protein [Mesorhizobium sp. B264B1A]TPI56083.1 DUF1203 domain-containing protein [Mesorhizobium sp. B3-1-1]